MYIYMCVLSHSVVSNWVPLSIGFFRQEYWSELPLLTPGDVPYLGIKPISPVSPALQADSLPTEPSGNPQEGHSQYSILSVNQILTSHPNFFFLYLKSIC